MKHEHWSYSVCRSVAFVSRTAAVTLQIQRLRTEDGSEVGVNKTYWDSGAQAGACEARQKLALVLVASNLNCMCFLQKPEPFT